MTVTRQFSGKYSFASDDPSHATVFAAPSSDPGQNVTFPAMVAESVGRDETWIAYATDTGLMLQMGNLLYLTQEDAIGTVVAGDDPADASRFAWSSPEAPGATTTSLTISVAGGWETVRYGFNALVPSYLVYPINGATTPDGSITTFVRTRITPSLAVIQSTKLAAGFDLRDVDLTNADLTGVDLSNADFTGATLDGARIRGGSLAGATFNRTSMKSTDVSGTVLDGAIFTGTDVGTVIWGPGSSARATKFLGCIGVGAAIGSPVIADWSHADLTGSDFTEADLTNVNLSAATFERCVLTAATLQTTNLSGAVLGGVSKSIAANLSFAYLTNVNFDKTNCFGVTFAFASLFGALTNLTETASLEQADFANAYLEGINLSGANLRGSRFDNACLIGANLTTADLGPTSDASTATSLAGACLHGAQFTQAKLEGVDFTGSTVAFQQGSVNVRYCERGSGPFPPPPDYIPMRYKPTVGLDATTLQPDTVCPNGNTFSANMLAGNDLKTMLTVRNPATDWVPVRCFIGGPPDVELEDWE